VRLEPDRDAIEIFVDALFRYAAPKSFVSLRAFTANDKPFRITPTQMTGGAAFLIEAAMDDAYRAANAPVSVVFCPPVATFKTRDSAKETDIAQGLSLTVEMDAQPARARSKLEELIGPATMVVRSGGTWVDPATGASEPKLHLHWRLAKPAEGAQLADLKAARRAATAIVGGDPSNVPTVHPIRWPGSWHRKGEPVLATIDNVEPDREINLADALAILREAAEPERPQGNGADHHGDPADWPYAKIVAGLDYHASLVSLSAKYVAAGMTDGAIVNSLRALMDASTGERDDRWQARFDAIPRIVRSAREKIAAPAKPAAKLAMTDATTWQDRPIAPRRWWSHKRVPARNVTLLGGDGGTGKTLVALQAGAGNAIGPALPDWVGSVIENHGPTIFFSAEEDEEEIHRRLAAILAQRSLSFTDLQHRFHLHCQPGEDATLAAPDRTGKIIATPLFAQLELAALDIRPTLTIIESAADVFSGDETNRPQVRAFITLLRRLAIKADTSVLLLQHPSVAGLASGSGTSGSTAWNNSVRSRLNFVAVKGTDDEPDPDLRELIVMKANYAQKGETTRVRWVDGVFVLEGTASHIDRAADAAPIDDAFLRCLDLAISQGRTPSHLTGRNYAPAMFAAMPDARGTKAKGFALAMERLLSARCIRVITTGPPSKPKSELVRTVP
jgi:RecA-family ATPase